LRNRFGLLDDAVEAQVRALSLNHLEALTDDWADLDTPADLQMWLLHRLSPPAPATEVRTEGSLEMDG
jgi:hypothetical protein